MLEGENNLKNDEDGVIRHEDGLLHCRSRLRFWRVASFFKCPLVGMCLTLSEQKQLLKRAGVPCTRKSPFEIHEILVACSNDENPLSRRIDDFLSCKFGKGAAAWLVLEDRIFMDRFRAAMRSGEFTEALWAAAFNPGLSMKCRGEVFGEGHMAMHCTAEERMTFAREMARRQRESNDLRRELKDTARRCRLMRKEIESHQSDRAALRFAVDLLEKEKNELREAVSESGIRACDAEPKPETCGLPRDHDELRRRLEEARRQVEVLEEKNGRLSAQLDQQMDVNRHFLVELRTVIAEMTALNRCNASCPAFDLCRKRILVVGGITRMEALYRGLIEGSGGIFEYHDGYVKKGAKALECSLRRADVVLCPVSCNSHAACSIVKNLGRKHNKPVYMLPNSSLSAISRVIWGGDGTVNECFGNIP